MFLEVWKKLHAAGDNLCTVHMYMYVGQMKLIRYRPPRFRMVLGNELNPRL
jgi:hypothetical protein